VDEYVKKTNGGISLLAKINAFFHYLYINSCLII
jgi:hypothetical protein